MKLNNNNLSQLSADILRPTYDRQQIRQGIVHIGVGGFHRAHQAVYTDKLLNQGLAQDWGICGAGLRPDDRAMRDALAAQDYLYTLYELGDTPDTEVRVIGSIGDFLLAEDTPEGLLNKLAHPNTRIVSLTITEGGYCCDDSTGEFLADLPEIRHDLANPQAPRTVFGFLAEALARRRAAGVTPFTVMSCDNVPHNGHVARKALLAFTRLLDPVLCSWIADNVSFPNAMVDRITPMTGPNHRQQLQAETGIEDAWPVVCEPFTQWVLEDNFCNGRPEWEKVGVQFTDDVTPYESMKIRLLNGSHLAMCYLGILMGYRVASETMEDALLQRYVRAFMDLDVTPHLAPVPGIDLDEYKDTLIERFANRAIGDQLGRIAFDGSSKFSKFVFPTLYCLIDQNKPLQRVALIVAAWAHYLRGVDDLGQSFPTPDPRAEMLQQAIADDNRVVDNLLALDVVFGQRLPKSQAFVDAFREQLKNLETLGARATLEKIMRD